MQLTQHLDSAISWTGTIVSGTSSADYKRTTPCHDWDVHTLATHLVDGTLMFAGALKGDDLPDDAPGDVVGEDPGAAYAAASAAFREAAAADDVLERQVTLPIGTVPGQVALNLALVDTLAHGWDLAIATGQPADLPAEPAAAALAFSEQLIYDQIPGPDGPFAAAVSAPADATPGERLVAFLGRDPRP